MSEETEDERWERLSRDRIHRPLPKRFYKSVAVTDQLGIALDGRNVKTPLKAALVLPTRPLAEAVAAEWDAQVDVINPHAMPLTKLANTAIDRAIPEKSKIAAEILEFAGSDMVCYRAESPAGLVQRQTDPLGSHHCLGEGRPEGRFCNGEHHHPQAPVPGSTPDPGSSNQIARPIFICRSPQPHHTHRLGTAGDHGGSRQNSADAAWLAANVDEDWQIETWGEDAEARARRAGRFKEFSASVKFVNLARGHS